MMNVFAVVAAGNAFCQAARLHMQMQNKLDSATSFVDAGNAYKKADPQGESDECTITQSWRELFLCFNKQANFPKVG